MERNKSYQEDINNAIRLAISDDAFYIGKSIVYHAKRVLSMERVKKELNIDFDQVIINPTQYNSSNAEIILLKKDEIIKKINAKTCVSGNLESSLITLKRTKRYDEDGLIIFGIICTKLEIPSKRMLGTLLIDKVFLYTAEPSKLLSVIVQKLKQKQKEENCKELTTYSLNQLIAMDTVISAIRATEFLEKVIENSLTVEQTTVEARDATKEAVEFLKEAVELSKLVVKKIDKVTEIVSELVEQNKENEK